MTRSFAEVLDARAFVWGEGEAPPELRRFNLAAFAFPGWWSLLDGLFGWWLIFAARYFVLVSVSRTVFPQPGRPRPWDALPLTLSEPQRWVFYLGVIAANVALELWFGKNAGRLVWETRGRKLRRERERGEPPTVARRGVEGYERAQRGCATTVLALFALSAAALVVQIVTPTYPPRPVLSWVASAAGYVSLAVGAGWWWLDRRVSTP